MYKNHQKCPIPFRIFFLLYIQCIEIKSSWYNIVHKVYYKAIKPRYYARTLYSPLCSNNNENIYKKTCKLQGTKKLFLSLENLRAESFLKNLVANYVVLNFDLLSILSLNFPKISASFFIGPFFIIGDCM